MDWQELAALAIVFATVALFAWSRLRPRPFRLKATTHCGGCSSAGERPVNSSIVFHARKGERPRILVKLR